MNEQLIEHGIPEPLPDWAFPVMAAWAEQPALWDVIRQVLGFFETHSLAISAEDIRRGVAAGSQQMFGLWWQQTLAMAVTCVVDSSRGAICSAILLLPEKIDKASTEKLVGLVEYFAITKGCKALSIHTTPWHAAKVSGVQKTVVIERDLQQSARPN